MINEQHALQFCKDDISKIENYEKAVADTTQTWHCHHRLELTLDGEFAHSKEDLIRMDMYYNRPYFELIFLTHAEHRRLHNSAMSDKMRKKISEAAKGNQNMKGKVLSNETRKKMSEAKKNMSDETRRKLSEAAKGKPSHFLGKHHSYEARKKMSEAKKARRARQRNPI